MNDYDEPPPEPEELLELFPPSEGGPGVRKTQPESAIEQRLREAFLESRYFEPSKASSPLVVGHGPLGLLLRELPVVDGRYRVDFAIVDAATDTFVAIECDGHEWHEKSKEQVQRDKARDRALTADGWRVLRFTGSEVWSDPAACVREIVAMLLPDSKQRVG